MATVVTMALHSVHSVSKHTVSLNEACTALLEPLSSSFYSFLSSIFFFLPFIPSSSSNDSLLLRKQFLAPQV